MSRILRFFVCLGTLFFASNALAAGYSCSSLPKYLSCQHGYYMTSSQSSTTYNGTPKVGNYCQPCSRMGSNYTCAGGTAAPVQSAGGYTCPTYMKYTSCSVGYYMTDSSTSTVPDGNPKVRNACRPCSVYGANYTCAGGTAAPQAIKINVTCPKGQYLPQGATSCTTCPAGSYCPGQTCNGVSLVTGATSACGLSSCPTNYTNSATGSSSINQCYLTLSAGQWVPRPGFGVNNCPAGSYCDYNGQKIYYSTSDYLTPSESQFPTYTPLESCAYGSYSSAGASGCTACPAGRTTSDTGSTSCDVTCSNSANVSKWKTPQWTPNYVSNLCKIDSCVACTKGTGVASCSASIVNNTCTYTATCASGYKNPTCNGSSCSCEISTYTVTLNATANGGTGGTSVVYQMPGTGWYSNAAATNAISSITMPTKTNSVFNGYYSAQSGGTRYITNAGALPSNTPFSSNTTLYAQYSAASCNVTNGSATMSISGNKVSCAVTCNTGYSQSGGTNATTSFTVTGAVGAASVSASCSPRTFTVSLMNYDGTSTHSTIYEKYATGWYSNSAATTTLSKATVPTRAGYLFRGFYTAKQSDVSANGGSGTRRITADGTLPANTTFTANTSLYAAWAKDCTVPENGSCTATIGDDGSVSYITSCNTGYTLSGANTANPTCTPKIYTITLNATAGGGTGGTSTIYLKYATGWYSDAAATKAITSITMPTKTNSICEGYFFDETFGSDRFIGRAGNIIASNTAFTANTTWYAHYEDASCNITNGSGTVDYIRDNAVTCYVTCNTGYSRYGGTDTITSFSKGGSAGYGWVIGQCFARTSTVSFDANGGTGGQSANVTAKYDSAMPSISTTAPTRTGYAFMGWYDNATYTSGTQYYTAAGASARTWNKVADATLYAGWKVNSYTCSAGQYLKAGATACTTCTANSWCGGGTFSFNSGTDQGLNACPSDYSYSDAGTSSENNCYKNATNTGSQIAPALPTGCAAQTVTACHPDKCWYRIYKSGTTTSCTPTNCNQTHKACTSASKNYYLASGVAKSCSSADASYPSSDGGDIAASSCYGTFSKTGSQVNGSVPTGCASVTSWNACTPGTCQYTKYASGTVKTDCTPTNCTKTVKSVTASAKYYANGTSCSACPSGYPNSDAGNSGGITACYSNSKSRAWTGSQVNGSTPTNCNSVTSWNACSLPACSYVAYSNSTGNGDGTIKSGCSTNNANCTKTVKSVTASAKYYANGASCSACPSGYPNSDAGNSGGITACYSNSKSRAWTGSQVNGSTPTNCNSVTSWNACSLPVCAYVAYSNSSGNGDGTIKSGCSTNNASCTKTVAAVTAKSGYYVSGTSCTQCKELASGMYPNSDNGNTGGASACRTNSLSGQVIATANASSATQCVAGTFKAAHTVNYGGTSSCGVCSNNQYSDAGAASCTGCKTANGYTNSGTTAASHAGEASCKATCAAGTYVATAGSACTTVDTGYWGAGGTVSQNTTLGRNQCPEKYRDGAAATQKSDCAVQTTAGKYIAAANDSTQTTCPAKNYCPSASVAYGSVNSPTACPAANSTTERTTYPTDYLNVTERGYFGLQSWPSGLKAITDCMTSYSFVNEAGRFIVENVGYNTTTGKYDVDGIRYYTMLNPGWYLKDRLSSEYCNTTSNPMYYSNVVQCPEDHYCPGYTTMPLCSSGEYTTEKGKNACSSLGTGIYTKSPVKSGAETACYLTTTAGKYVAASKAAESACKADGWCPGGVRVNYGSTGGRNTCPTKYPSSSASSNSELDCYVTTAAGKYVATVGAGQVNCAGTGYYCPGGTNVYSGAYGSRLTTGGRTLCPAGYRDLVATASTTKEAQCTMNVAGGKYVATAKESAASGTCAAGYAKAAHSVTYGNTSSCAACTGTTYAENTGQASCTACPTQSGVTNISYWISTGTHTDANGCYGFYNNVALNNGSAARIQCFWDKNKSQYDTSCGAMKDGLKCNAAYYNAALESSPTNNAAYYTDKASVIAKACTSVGKGYWSPADVYTRTQCPAGYRDGAAGVSEAQCTMNVAGGKYVAKANESAASGTCAAGYAKAAHSVTYGNTSSCAVCTGATYAASTGQASCTACPTAKTYASAVKSYGYWNNGKDGDHTISDGCYATMTGTLSNGSLTEHGCYLGTDGDYGNGGGKRCYVHQDNLKCNAGYYASTLSNGYVWNNTRAGLLGNTCVGVGAGYYSAANILTRNQCPTGLTTIGYGAGADEVTDCGRILHFGDDKLYLRSGKKTTPSLNVKIGDTTYYGNMTAGTGKGKLRLKSGSTTYSVHDDSM